MKKIISICLLFVLLLTACGTPNPPLEGSGTTVPTDNETTLSDDTNTTVPDDTDTTVPGDTDTTVPDDTDTTVPDDTDTTVPDNIDTSTPGSDEPDIPEEQVRTTLAPYEAGWVSSLNSLCLSGSPPLSLALEPYDDVDYIIEENIEDSVIVVNGIEYTGKYRKTTLFGYHGRVTPVREYRCQNEGVSFKIDKQTGALANISWTYETLDQGATRIYTQEECQEIAETFITEYVLSAEPNIDFSDYVLSVTDNWANRECYAFEYLRWVDGYETQDRMRVCVTHYGSIHLFTRGDDYSALETMEIDYERAEKAALDLANEIVKYVREGKIKGIYNGKFYRYCDGTYVIEYFVSIWQKGAFEEQNLSGVSIAVSVGKPPSTESNSQ